MKVFKSSKRRIFLFLFTSVWIVAVVVSILFLVTSRMVTFDKNQVIYQRFPSISLYLDELSVQLPELIQDEPIAIRIIEKNCSCNSASSAHWVLLKKIYPKYNYIEIELNDLSEAVKKLVPATPMAIVIQQPQKVSYAGPFSDANYCNSDNSLIEAYLAELITNRYSSLETQGCYCSNHI